MKNLIIPLLFVVALIINATSFASENIYPEDVIELHNEIRAKHKLTPLNWSKDLSGYAQQWVDHLAQTKNCAMTHRPNNESSPFQQTNGENLYWSSALEYEDGTTEVEALTTNDIIETWASEEDFYDYETNTCMEDADCGHYTQIVWHETKEVGCAVAVCDDKSQIWACNYSPRGNYVGEWPY